MPAKSPEAIERKRLHRLAKDRAKAAAKRTQHPKPSIAASPVISFRAPDRGVSEMGKRDLREMLAEAVRNTAALA
jgi:hypothetical protein